MSAAVANSVGVMGLDMAPSLHRANQFASLKVCGARDDLGWPLAHTAYMADADRNYLKEWREFRGMTQDQLAEAVGTNKAVISLLENEKRPLSSKWLRKFAEVLNTQPGYILDNDPNEVSADIFDLWARIGKDNRKQAAEILSTFTGTKG